MQRVANIRDIDIHYDFVAKKSAQPAKDSDMVSHVLLNLREHPGLLREIDEFRWQGRFESRSEAIRWLLSFALKQKPKRESQN